MAPTAALVATAAVAASLISGATAGQGYMALPAPRGYRHGLGAEGRNSQLGLPNTAGLCGGRMAPSERATNVVAGSHLILQLRVDEPEKGPCEVEMWPLLAGRADKVVLASMEDCAAEKRTGPWWVTVPADFPEGRAVLRWSWTGMEDPKAPDLHENCADVYIKAPAQPEPAETDNAAAEHDANGKASAEHKSDGEASAEQEHREPEPEEAQYSHREHRPEMVAEATKATEKPAAST